MWRWILEIWCFVLFVAYWVFVWVIEHSIGGYGVNKDQNKGDNETSHAFYKSIVDTSPTAYALHKVILDELNNPCDYEFVEVNKAFEQLTTLSAADIIGKRVTAVLPGILQSDFNWIRFYGDIAMNGRVEEFEQFAEPLHRWYKVNAYSPKKGYFVTHFVDISKLKSYQNELEEAEWKFKALFEKGPIGVAYHEMIYDEAGKPIDYRFIDANEAYQTLTGVNPIGKLVTEAFPGIEKDKFDWIGTFGKVAKTGESFHFEQYLESNDRWYDCVSYQYKPNHFVAAFSEITSRKKLEATLKQTINDLLASQKTAHLGTWRLNVLTNEVVWSEELYKMYGFDPTQPPPPYTEHMKLFTPKSWADLSEALNITRTLGIPYELELETITKDGSNGWMWVMGEAVKDSSGAIIGLWGAAQDITERIKSKNEIQKINEVLIANKEELEALNEELRTTLEDLEAVNNELNKAKDLAEEANISKSHFLANMSHEIRTPMNGLMGMLQLLQTTTLDKEQHELTNVATASANSLLALVNDILDYSRIEAGKIELETKDFNLEDLIHEVITLFRVSANTSGLSIYSHIPKDIPNLFSGDAFRIKQIVSNLIGNAIKFTKSGSVTLSVSALRIVNERQAELEIVVEDTGIGIPEDKLDSLFKRFSQLDSSTTRLYGGSGLGLAICKGLVKKMGGDIWVQSQVGVGSRFYFTCLVEIKTATPINDTSAQLAAPQHSHNIAILLAEDDDASRMLIEIVAIKKGWQVISAKNGKEAVALFTKHSFDIVFMDIQMPVMNGYMATGLIRALEKATDKHTPIIALTAYSIKGDREKCLQEGMDDYLSKPVNLGEFNEMVLKWTHD